MLKYFDKRLLSPLTVLHSQTAYPLFYKYFFVLDFSFEERLDVLTNAVKIFTPAQSDEATDLRFLSVNMMLFKQKIKVMKGCEVSIDAFENYITTDHEDEKMRMYRPTIRCFELIVNKTVNEDYVIKFWKDIGMLTPCKLVEIGFSKKEIQYEEFLTSSTKILEFVQSLNKELTLNQDKYHVLIGSLSYVLKIFKEIYSTNLGEGLLGRLGFRTIAEVFINIKYLLKIENEKDNVWTEYKVYGIGKLKLPVLKAREKEIDEYSHFKLPLLDALVNEAKWEEFVDVDLKYFDNTKIRKKSEMVEEKDLYGIEYDYDTNYVHGFWGAIRESSMLNCENPAHRYYSVPDIYASVKCSDVLYDAYKLIVKFFKLIQEIYEVPKELLDDLEIKE